ncbi:hypothetical protein PC116_g28930 [Phytophthora cactorum]|nr:hypothetical protein PC116_g28930 [Phytophthora cactorum]
MAAPNDGYGQYPPQEYGQEAPYSDQPPAGYEGQTSPPPQATSHHDGKKKKRGYATQAFEFGSGANAGATVPTPGGITPGYGGPVPGPQPSPGYAGGGAYPTPDFQQGGYGSPAPGQVPYGAPQQPGVPQPGLGGYQAPDPYYQPGVGQPPPGVAGITQGMAGMNMGPGPQPAVQQPGQQARIALNQLYPTDLLNQPFNVSELDLPPPPCILPPNVSSYGNIF